MIKLFRKIRYDLMEKNKTGKYLKYAIGEIVLVVIGILIALQINNWNENKKRTALEIKHLKELKSDIMETLKDAKTDANLYKEDIQSIQYLQDFFFQKTTYHDSLAYHFYRSIEHYQLYAKTSALESIKSIGLDIISNDSLRLGITDFYQIQIKDAVDLGRVSQGSNSFTNKLWPYFEKHFKPIDKPIRKDSAWYNNPNLVKYPPKQWEVLDVEALQKDYPLQLKLNRTLILRQGMTSYLNVIITNGKRILELIDDEITFLE
jgi:type II secretory pathway pseudopilin PulG